MRRDITAALKLIGEQKLKLCPDGALTVQSSKSSLSVPSQAVSAGAETFEYKGARRVLRINAAESPLSWLASRKGRDGEPMISALQKQAGDRLAVDHERGHRRERITQNWDPSGVRGTVRRDGISVADAAVAARRRVEDAISAVGPGLAEALVGVCCEELGLEAVEKRLGWPPRSGKVVLRLALDRLAAHYGMGGSARGSSSAIVHWGGEGYRPSA